MNRIDRLTAILLLLQGGKHTAGEIARRFLDPTHSGRVTMDNLMKLVTTALEWSYLAGERR